MEKKAYWIEMEREGCSTCGHGQQWMIIGPDEIGSSQTYGSKEEAEYICELQNEAYELGLRAGRQG